MDNFDLSPLNNLGAFTPAQQSGGSWPRQETHQHTSLGSEGSYYSMVSRLLCQVDFQYIYSILSGAALICRPGHLCTNEPRK